jgi:hypothetical protein
MTNTLHLKHQIMAMKANEFRKIDEDDLTLWQVTIPSIPAIRRPCPFMWANATSRRGFSS